MPSVKIVLLTDSLHSIAAGSERQIFKLAEGLTRAGHQVQLILLRHTEFTQTGFEFPCPVRVLHITSIASPHAVKVMLNLRKELLAEQVNVVHAYFPDACLLAPLFLKSKRLRLITSRRDMGLIYEGKPAWLFRALAPRSDLVISNSSAVSAFISEKEGLKPHQNRVIYNGIEDFTPDQHAEVPAIFTKSNSIKLILVANIKPVKRTLDAVAAVNQLIKAGHAVELALAGERQHQEYVKQIEDYIEAAGIASSIHWLGQINEPRRLLRQADIGLLISQSEGLSNTIMEYMQAGLPVIATDVGGNPELVFHEVNGLLIERGNIEQLAEAILRLSAAPELRQQYGKAGAARIDNEFSLTAMVNHHLSAYAEAT